MSFVKNLKVIAWNLTCDEKEKLRNEVWNVILDKKRYEQVMQFRNDNAAIKNMKRILIHVCVLVTKTWFETLILFCQIHSMKIFFVKLLT